MRSIDEILKSDHPRPVVIAHRGASHYFKENTMEAFKAAVDMQAEMMEFDVRRTRDGILVVHHDPDIKGSSISGILHEDVPKAASGSGYEIPTLSQVLAYCRGKLPLDIELKEAGYEKQVLEEVLEALDPEQFIISSAHDSVIRKVKDLQPPVRTGWILSSRPRWQLMTRLYPEKRAMRAGADLLVVSRKLLKLGFLSTTRDLKLPVWIYTVNERQELWKMITDERVAGIFTDRPDVALFLRDLYALGKRRDMPPSISVPE